MPLSTSAQTRLQYQHTTIHELIAGLTEQQLKCVLTPGKWSVFDNIAHLACYQPMFFRRLERMQTENAPSFDRYAPDTDPHFPEYQRQSLGELLSAIDAQRAAIIAKLQGMSEDDLKRTARHPRDGWLDVPRWIEFFLLHEAHHLYTIFMLVQAQRKILPE